MRSTGMATMAWRNLRRNRRRTALTVFGISFGVLLAVIFTGVGDSSYADMIDLAARMGTGHVTVQHLDYLDTPSVSKTVTGTKKISTLAAGDENVKNVSTRITGQVLLATSAASYGAAMLAIDPQKENKDTFALFDSVDEGEMFETGADKGIIIGAKLAENLDTKMGRKVVYTLTDKSGEIVSGLARVKGILRTGSQAVDAGLCILPIDTVRKTLGFDTDEATQVAVFLDDQRNSGAVAQRLEKAIGGDAQVLTWDKSNPALAGFIGMKVSGTVIFEILILILIAAGIFNTIFVSVMERMREFGIMSAIGFSPGKIFSLVMWESLWIGIIGLISAAVITAYPYYLMATKGIDVSQMTGSEQSLEVAGVAMSPVIYADIYPESVLMICLAVLGATLLSGLYPAWRAGKVVPVESIKLV